MPDNLILNAVPSTPDAATVTQAATLVRALLFLSSGVTGALGIVMPQISDSQLNAYVTAGLIVWAALSTASGVIWGLWKNRKKAQEGHRDNVASAAASAAATAATGVPTPVAVEVSPVAVQASPVPALPVAVPAALVTATAPPVPSEAVAG